MPLNITNLERNKPLAPFTTYKIGGLSDFFVEVHTIDTLLHALVEARRNKIPFFLLGCGANILVTDKGFRGLVIRNLADKISFPADGTVAAESGRSPVAEYKVIFAGTSIDDFDVVNDESATYLKTFPSAKLFNLYLDPKERYSFASRQTFMDVLFSVPYKFHKQTFVEYPPKKYVAKFTEIAELAGSK